MADIKEELQEEYSPDIITLTDEEGAEYSFEVIDAADFDEVRYLAVVPYSEGGEALEEDAELVIMRVGEDENDEYLDVVEDEEELNRIGALFAERLADLYDIDAGDI